MERSRPTYILKKASTRSTLYAKYCYINRFLKAMPMQDLYEFTGNILIENNTQNQLAPLDILHQDVIDGNKKKRDYEELLLKVIKKKLFHRVEDITSQLQLQYIASHSKMKVWHGYRFEGAAPEPAIKLLNYKLVRTRIRTIQNEFEAQKITEIHAYSHGEMMWLYFGRLNNKGGKKSPLVVAYNLEEPYLFVSQRLMPIDIGEIMLEFYNSDHLQSAKLEGKHIPSLATLLRNQDSKTSLESTDVPGFNVPGVKRPVTKVNEVISENLVDDTAAERSAKRRKLQKTYGTQKLPVINVLKLQSNCTLQGNIIDYPDIPFPVTITFKGPDVLSSISEFVDDGTITSPVPWFFKDLPHLGSNNVNVEKH